MFEELRKVIEQNDSFVIFGHINPDGDCYGGQLGLRNAIRLNCPNKKAYAVGSGYRRFFDHIGYMDEISDDVIKNSVAILLDGNDIERMEDTRIRLAKSFFKIDHHVENGLFTEGPFVVDENASSTCELIARLIKEFEWKVNTSIANPLYLGLLTDTGRFQYIEDFSEVFELAKWLVDNGAEAKKINSILNVSNLRSLDFKGYIYSHYEATTSGVLYVVFDKKTLNEYKLSASKAGNMVNLLSNIDGFPVWICFAENEDGSNHVEIRSNGPTIQPVADKYGGGGHSLAAGVTLPKFNKESIQMIVNDCNEVVDKFLGV